MTVNISIETNPQAPNLDTVLGLDGVPRIIVTRAADYKEPYDSSWHQHERSQLLYASRGVMTVTTQNGIWVVPPQRAVWVPAGTAHQASSTGPLSFRSIYVSLESAVGLPSECCVIAVPPLLRELILQAVQVPRLYDENGPDGRLMAVLLDQIRELKVTPLHLPGLNSQRLQPIAQVLYRNPADTRTLEAWAQTLAISTRTLARLFKQDTGISFREWRQQLRLLEALRHLAEKQAVTKVAMDLGYESTSAFIAMFRRALGITPARYFSN